jgi:hypothetical protein
MDRRKRLVWKTTEIDLDDNWIEARVRDKNHSGPDGFDDRKTASFSVAIVDGISSKGSISDDRYENII